MPFQVGGYVSIARTLLAGAAQAARPHARGRRVRECVADRGAARGRRRRVGRAAEARRDHRSRVARRADRESRARRQHEHATAISSTNLLAARDRGCRSSTSKSAVPDDLPILGSNAVSPDARVLSPDAGTRFMDLPPEAIGGTYGYRICPVVSRSSRSIAGRLAQVTGQPARLVRPGRTRADGAAHAPRLTRGQPHRLGRAESVTLPLRAGRRNAAVTKPADDAVYKTLLESTTAIPWKIDWSTMRVRVHRPADRGAARLGARQLEDGRGLGRPHAPRRSQVGRRLLRRAVARPASITRPTTAR